MLASAVACGSGTAGAGGEAGAPGVATLLAEVDANHFCNMPEVVDLVIRAVRVACEPGPPAPCTLPSVPETIEGDVATCPVTDPSRLMGVEVTEVGRYQVEIVGRFTTVESTTACVHAAGGEVEVVVTQADLDSAATLDLEATRDPCS